jgi:hypothetical protein
MGSTDMILCVDSLQELIAPRTVRFYSMDWRYLGSKLELQENIQQITGIEAEALTAGTLETFSIARRMSWAAKRETTRIEDQAYSLMGIFDVNMPLLYGEGQKAFVRLQEAVLKVSDDQSLFAWGLPAEVKTMQQFCEEFPLVPETPARGLFAKSPSEFTNSELIHVLEDEQSALPPIVSSNGVRIELQVKQYTQFQLTFRFAIIYCTLRGRYHHYIGFPIWSSGKRWVVRYGEPVTVPVTELVAADSENPFRKPSVLFIKSSTPTSPATKIRNTIKLIELQNRHQGHYSFDGVHCAEHASYSPTDRTLTLVDKLDTLHAVFFYVPVVSGVLDLFSFTGVEMYANLRSSMRRTMNEAAQQYAHIFAVKGKLYKDHRWLMAHMPFAICVGGNEGYPWVKIMIILSEENPQKDFRALAEADKNFMSCCTTKSNLLSLLNQSRTAGLPFDYADSRARQMTMRSDYLYGPGSGNQVTAQLGVDAQIDLVATSLAEQSLALFVEIESFGEHRSERQRQRPHWWALRDPTEPDDK